MVELKKKNATEFRKRKPKMISARDIDGLHDRLKTFADNNDFTLESVVQVAVSEFLDAKGARPITRTPMTPPPQFRGAPPATNGSGY